jgi:hypothetical protein
MANKKNMGTSRKRPRRYMKRAARRTIAALLMITALIVAAIPATPGKAATFDGKTCDYIYIKDSGDDKYCLYFNKGTDNKIVFVGFDNIEVERSADTSSGIETVTKKLVKKPVVDTAIEIPDSMNVYGDGFDENNIGDPTDVIQCDVIGNGSSDGITNREHITMLTCNTATKINSYAFEGSDKLSAFTGNSVTEIEGHAFDTASALKSITLGPALSSIGDYAFNKCSNLTSFPVDATAPLSYLGSYSFAECTSLDGNITIPSPASGGGSVGSLELHEHAFFKCSKLKGVTLDAAYTLISESAFEDCSELATFILPADSKLAKVEQDVFKNCSSLKEVDIPGGIGEMPEGIFTSCENLSDVYLHNDGNTENDITLDLGKEYFYPGTGSDYTVTVHGYRNIVNSNNRTKAYNYCLKKKINYDCAGYDGGYASDYYGIDQNGKLTDFYEEKWKTQMVNNQLVIPEQVGGITVTEIPGDLLTDTYTDSLVGHFKSVKVECDGATADEGAFNFGDEIEFFDFTGVNNIWFDADSPTKMFKGASGFYVQGDLIINPDTAASKYNRSTKALSEISQDNDDTTSNSYVFSEKYGYVYKGVDGKGTLLTISDTKPYTLADVNGNTKAAITQSELSLPTGVLFVDGTLADDSADNYQADDSIFYGNTNLSEFSAEGLLELRDLQFGNCTSLSKVTLPATLQNCGVLPFKGCTSLYNDGFTVNENYFKKDSNHPVLLGPNGSSTEAPKGTMIYEALEYSSGSDDPATLTNGKTYRPSAETAIKPRAFTDNHWVGTFDTTESQITVIPKYCFQGATKLVNIKLSNSTREVEQGAFDYNKSVEGGRTLSIYNSSGLATTYAQSATKKALWLDYDSSFNTGDARHKLYGLVSGADQAEGLAKDNLYQQYYNNQEFLQYAGAFAEKKLTDTSVELNMKTDMTNPIKFEEGQPVNFSDYYTLTDTEDGVHKTPLVEGSDFTLEFNPTVDWNNPSDMDKVTVTFRGAGEYSSDDQDVLVRTFAMQNKGTPATARKLDHVGYPASSTINSAPRKYTSPISFSEGADYIVYDSEDKEVNSSLYTITPSLTSVSVDQAGQTINFTVRGDGKNTSGTVFGSFTVLPKGGSISDAYKIKLINPIKQLDGSSVTWTASASDTGGDFFVCLKDNENTILVPGTDYTYSPMSATTVGTVPFTVTGTGNYSGLSLSSQFTVTQGSSSSTSSSSSSTNPKESTLSVNLILNGPDRTAVDAATYKSTNTFQYWGEGDPGIKSVIDKYGNVLTPGTDYDLVAYSSSGLGKDAGRVTIQFKGKYADEGRQVFTYTIKKDLSRNTSNNGSTSVTISVPEATIDSNDKIEATIKLTDSTTGKDLVKDTDYIEGGFKKTSDHHADVTITGKGDKYVGTYKYNFRMDEKNSSSSSSSKSSSSSSSKSSSSGSNSSSGTGGNSNGNGNGSGNKNTGTTIVNRNYYNSDNGRDVDELADMLRAAHIDAINGGSADGYQVNITKKDSAEQSFREALLRRYGTLENIRYYSMDIELRDKNGNEIDTTGITVTMTLPLPRSMEQYGTNNRVATVDSNGDLEDLNVEYSTLEGRPCATFTAPHFSPYGFYVDTSNLVVGTLDNTPKTGDPISPKWFISLGLAALSIFLFLKKDPKPKAEPA